VCPASNIMDALGERAFSPIDYVALSEIRTGENRFKPQLWPFDPDIINTSKLTVCPQITLILRNVSGKPPGKIYDRRVISLNI
jgi:hypothetical protein